MSIHIDPLLPTLPLLMVVAAYVAMAAFFYRGYRSVLSRRYVLILVAAKSLSVVAVLLLLLNPSLVKRVPDPGRFRIAILLDASGSMDVSDCKGRTRLEVIKAEVLDPASSLGRVLGRYPNRQIFLFSSGDPHLIDLGQPFDSLPGNTDIDGALKWVIEQHADRLKLGAVLLVSDGLDNEGAALREGVRPLRRTGIPVHAIGVGSTRPRPDVGVEWTSAPKSAQKGKAVVLNAKISRRGTEVETVRVSLRSEGRELDAKNVRFEKGRGTAAVTFEPIPLTAGFTTYVIRVTELKNEENVINNVDFASLTVHEPDSFDILYFSANLGWDFRFLAGMARKQDALNLDAVIRIGKEKYFIRGIETDDDYTGGFPPPKYLHSYDCLIVDLGSLYLLNPDQIQNLVDFVEHRGGGLIFTGVTDEVPAAIGELLPVYALGGDPVQIKKAAVTVRPGGVFGPRRRGGRPMPTAGFFLPSGAAIHPVDTDQVKPGAVTNATIDDTSWVAVSAHQYGGGKVALINIGDSWKWIMSSDDGGDRFTRFWGRLIVWAGSSTRSRMVVHPAASRLALAEETTISVDLLTAKYRPDTGARPEVKLIGPDGEEHMVSMVPSPNIDGRYIGSIIPRQSGIYRLATTFGEGDTRVEKITEYAVTDRRAEAIPETLAEAELRNLAKLTGGRYWNWREMDRIGEIPVTAQVRERREAFPWLQSWLFFIVLVLGIVPDWILRRRVGLR